MWNYYHIQLKISCSFAGHINKLCTENYCQKVGSNSTFIIWENKFSAFEFGRFWSWRVNYAINCCCISKEPVVVFTTMVQETGFHGKWVFNKYFYDNLPVGVYIPTHQTCKDGLFLQNSPCHYSDDGTIYNFTKDYIDFV